MAYMGVNNQKTQHWKKDIAESVDFYNKWFLKYAPKVYRRKRVQTTKQVEKSFEKTSNLKNISVDLLFECPQILPILRMCTAPPLARDRLTGLSQVPKNLVASMKIKEKIPPQMPKKQACQYLKDIIELLSSIFDKDILIWLGNDKKVSKSDIHRAATVIADRLCGSLSNPIIRNAQENRQLTAIKTWLELKGYRYIQSSKIQGFKSLKHGHFTFHLNIPVKLHDSGKEVNIPVDMAVMPKKKSVSAKLPLLFEAKSAGDFTNTNKRRKEEAMKIAQLRATYGKKIQLILFLCGYFDSGYLGYEAAEGLDWVWEHRMGDMAEFGL
jgi:hypothetical protein